MWFSVVKDLGEIPMASSNWRANSDFRSSARDAEERTASGKPFQTDVAAAQKALPPTVARTVRKMTSATDEEEWSC